MVIQLNEMSVEIIECNVYSNKYDNNNSVLIIIMLMEIQVLLN